MDNQYGVWGYRENWVNDTYPEYDIYEEDVSYYNKHQEYGDFDNLD